MTIARSAVACSISVATTAGMRFFLRCAASSVCGEFRHSADLLLFQTRSCRSAAPLVESSSTADRHPSIEMFERTVNRTDELQLHAVNYEARHPLHHQRLPFARRWPGVSDCYRTYLEQSASARHHHILSISLQSTSEDLPLCTVLLASIKCPRMTLVVRTLTCSR